ncbi:patatin-like phospholipase family protein [Terrabacter terrigena]|uniref:Patatin-like phospholipase family protein n=1 Tax=Terrabacter terrigena TaxID=574718 RepID=A0ABW3MXF0_9MICO
MTTSTAGRPTNPDGRALVLAGAGAAGNAWELGLIAGLAAGGVDVTRAELVIGTSAGATVAAQVTSGTSPADLYAAVSAVGPRRPGTARKGAPPRGTTVSGPSYLDWSNAIIGSASDPADMRRRLGAAALKLDESVGPGPSRWRDIVASRLPSHEWPLQDVRIVAVDALTGEPVVFDRHSGVDLVDAVAASTSAMTPYAIGAGCYLNGGYRRSENADLAGGFGRVLVMSPFSGRSRMPSGWGMDLATQVAELRAAGSTVETLFPDARSGDVFDANALDPATMPQAARGGHAQGLERAGSIAELWA